MKQPVDKLELGPALPNEEVGYWRVSTGRDQSPDMQIAELARRGISNSNIFGDVKSGRIGRRHGLEKALKLMEGRPGWTLVVWKLDRLGRNTFELHRLLNELQAKGLNLVSLTEAIDTRTALGRAFFGMMAVMAQFESDVNSERSRAGMARARERGSKIGRKSKLTLEQMNAIERLLLSDRGKPLTISRIARRFRVSTATVNNIFPGWRGKSPAQRKAWRRDHPLPRT